MRILHYNAWRLLVNDNLSDSQARDFFDSIQSKNYKKHDTLKQHHRSNVTRILYGGLDLVLKVPLEKNNRKWIRLLTLIRKGEAFKNLLGMHQLLSKGIKTTKPYLAAEKRVNGFVVDSWLTYEYVKGHNCLDMPEHYPKAVTTLKKMHNENLLHGDPQIRNFIASEDDLYVIDSNPSSASIPFDKAYEWAYLRRSCPEIENHFGEIKDRWLYKFAVWYDLTERKLKEKKRNLLNTKIERLK